MSKAVELIGTAVWFPTPRQVELRSERVPAPADGELLVRSVCSLISSGSEINVYRGEGNLPDRNRKASFGTFAFPIKFGYQVVGRVEAVGPGVALSPGDLVFCQHPHQDLFTIAHELAWKVPSGVTPEQAAFTMLFDVALNSCLTAPPLIGDCVVVSGMGNIGLLLAYLARRTASKLILIEPRTDRRSLAEWTRADAIVAPELAAETVTQLSDGRGADMFIEISGAPSALQLALELTGAEGTVVVPSWYGSREVNLRLSPEFHLRRHRILSTGPSLNPALSPRWDWTRMRQVAYEHLGSLDTLTLFGVRRVAFRQASSAYRLLDQECAPTGAVLLQY